MLSPAARVMIIPTIQMIEVFVMFKRDLVIASKSLVILTPFKLYAEIVKTPTITSRSMITFVKLSAKNMSIL